MAAHREPSAHIARCTSKLLKSKRQRPDRPSRTSRLLSCRPALRDFCQPPPVISDFCQTPHRCTTARDNTAPSTTRAILAVIGSIARRPEAGRSCHLGRRAQPGGAKKRLVTAAKAVGPAQVRQSPACDLTTAPATGKGPQLGRRPARRLQGAGCLKSSCAADDRQRRCREARRRSAQLPELRPHSARPPAAANRHPSRASDRGEPCTGSSLTEAPGRQPGTPRSAPDRRFRRPGNPHRYSGRACHAGRPRPP